MNELELRDIHLPDVSLWWPPAPGWWLLLALLLIAAAAFPWLRGRLAQKPLARLSMIELEGIRRQHENGQSERDTVNQVAGLLRRILISYRGRSAYAASAGEDWLDELARLAPSHDFDAAIVRLLAHERYRPDYECDVEDLLAACERWIRFLPPRPAHVAD
jgi:hypothetical protein